jgi:ferredoxin--NADP+ reductase
LKTYNIAIVGAGPAGYFSAQAFQNRETEDLCFKIDLYERLPTPWGLVRSGVAPDHQKIKSVSKVFEKVASHQNFRLFANVEVGKDVSLDDLKKNYDVVILATGASSGKKLNIPGENLKNVFSSESLVSWYNSHPDYEYLNVDLNCHRAVVIGAGNVAIDVARILLSDTNELAKTDIDVSALNLLQKSQIKEVIICGRRGPEHSNFTLPELRELPNLPDVEVVIDKELIEQAIERTKKDGTYEDKEIRNKLECLLNIATKSFDSTSKKLVFKFLVSPVEIIGGEKIQAVQFNNNVMNNSTKQSSEKFEIQSGLLISCTGYEPDKRALGEIENGKLKNSAGKISKNLYCVGWAKRGSSGVIGTNKSDATDVVEMIISELATPKNISNPENCIKPKKKIITQNHWQNMNNREIELGIQLGKPRLKTPNVDKLISLSGN